jgi:predicted Zn-dependent protease
MPTPSHRLFGLVAAGVMSMSLPAVAQPLSGPDEVVLYVHPDLKDARFIDPLVCALQRVLVAPVGVRDIDIRMGEDGRRPIDVERVGESFRRTAAADGTPRTFKHLLVPFDLKARTYNYVFAARFGSQVEGYRTQVVSTARLQFKDPKRSEAERAEVTAQRVYKIVLRGVIHHAGSWSQGCVLSFPNSLEELDRKSPAVCEVDRPAFVRAGILKEVESDECQAVASRISPLLIASRGASPSAAP